MNILTKLIDNLTKKKSLKYGSLYKLKNESLAFRYIFKSEDDLKKIYRFKHHQLKEYTFKDLSLVEREANKEEIRIYNLIKTHINEISN